MTVEICNVPLVQEAQPIDTTKSFALRCKELIASYKGYLTDTIPTKTCDAATGKTKIYAEWNGTGEPDLLTWYYGYWVDVGIPMDPKWQFNYVMPPLYGEQIMFMNVPLGTSSPVGAHTILLVATVGDCATTPTVQGQVCLPCSGGSGVGGELVDCSNCCVSTFDYCNLNP